MADNDIHWDALQREVLAALGHTLYVRTDPSAARADVNTVSASSFAPTLQDRDVSVPRTPEQCTPSRHPASPDALMQALLRAANLDNDGAAILQTRLPPLDTLAGNAQAKRMLWPTLRAMRTRHGT